MNKTTATETVPWYYYPAEQHRFERDTADHEMTILHDDGLYRHIRFKAPTTGIYWYELLTSPGQLTIRGDMGTYVFSRVEDMIGFFNQPYINAGYWGEKLQAHSGYREYSESQMRRLVREHFEDNADQLDDPPAVWRQIEQQILDEDTAPSEDLVHEALAAFDEGGLRFEDSWEWDLRDYGFRYLWCCHAVRAGIQRYLESTTAGRGL